MTPAELVTLVAGLMDSAAALDIAWTEQHENRLQVAAVDGSDFILTVEPSPGSGDHDA